MRHSTLRSFSRVAPMIFAAVGRLTVRNVGIRQLVDPKESQQRFREATLLRDARMMVGQKINSACGLK